MSSTLAPPEAPLAFDGVRMALPDGTHTADDVTFSVGTGELVSVVGPSGCGKSTLLRLASGLSRPSRGTVSVDRADLGYVGPDPALLPWRTVQGNVELLAQLHGIDRAERQELAGEAIRLVGLEGFERHVPRRLSPEMTVRVALARSLTMRPGVFLFDEPFGALHERTRDRLDDQLLRLLCDGRFAGLFVTHSVREAVFLSTRVIVLARPGRLVGDFTVPFDHPRPPRLRASAPFRALVDQVAAAAREP